MSSTILNFSLWLVYICVYIICGKIKPNINRFSNFYRYSSVALSLVILFHKWPHPSLEPFHLLSLGLSLNNSSFLILCSLWKVPFCILYESDGLEAPSKLTHISFVLFFLVYFTYLKFYKFYPGNCRGLSAPSPGISMYHAVLIIHEHLSCSCLLAIGKTAALNTRTQISACTLVFRFLWAGTQERNCSVIR